MRWLYAKSRPNAIRRVANDELIYLDFKIWCVMMKLNLKPKTIKLRRWCSSCGNGITPRVDVRTGKVMSKHHYFGTVDLSRMKRSKYVYSLDGKKTPNPLYDPSVKRKLPLEIWECDRCFRRAGVVSSRLRGVPATKR